MNTFRLRAACKDDGFTLVELLIALVLSAVALAAATSLFGQLYAQFKRESRVAQTDIGSALGLEYLRKDIQSAGYGLPWAFPSTGMNPYNEYAGSSTTPSGANDSLTNPPRAIVPVAGPLLGVLGDYLVIKSVSAAVNETAAGKSIPLQFGIVPPTAWTPTAANCQYDPENPCPTDNVIVLSYPQSATGTSTTPTLVAPGGAFSTTYNNPPGSLNNYTPPTAGTTYMVYDVADVTNAPAPTGLRMPFNRADYFVAPGGQIAADPPCPAVNIPFPARCAPNTGELVKGVLRHGTSASGVPAGCFDYYPLLDCVEQMNVNFQLASGNYASAAVVNQCGGTLPCDASWIRQNVREVRVFIVAQEGQKDPSYTSPAITVDPIAPITFAPPANQLNFRWKVYTIVEKPYNLGAQ